MSVGGNYKTTDGGQTWHYQQLNFPPLGNSIDKIWFVDSLIGYAISYRTILKTEDGGNSWVIQNETTNGMLQDIQFYDSQIGYVCGYGGTIYQTDDGGQNWLRYGEGVTENLNDVDFINENLGWAVGDYGKILHTSNGGQSWSKQNSPSECDSTSFAGVDFLDSKTGWVAGGEYILQTGNGGEGWQINFKADLEYMGAKGRLRDIKLLNRNVGFAVGQEGVSYSRGVLYETIDGGKRWQRVDHGDLPPLAKICFADEEYGWICGQGILLSTKDGGLTWHADSFPEFLRYIQFTDREHGWMSAIDEGAVYRTTDEGKTWTDIPYENRFNQFFNSFFFFNDSLGLASTFLFCDILTTKDGGLHWTREERLPPIRLNELKFVNDTLGWAVGTNGCILRFHGSYFGTGNNGHGSNGILGNYPNPFRGETTIYFMVSYPQEVFVSIYDILGRQVKLFPETSANQGANEIKWLTKDIASGMYFVRIQCLEFSKVVKCMVLK